MGFQRVTIYDVDGAVEEIGNVFLEIDLVEHGHPDIRIDLDHDVDVAIRTAFAARQRTEQGGVHHPALAQGALGSPQGLDRF